MDENQQPGQSQVAGGASSQPGTQQTGVAAGPPTVAGGSEAGGSGMAAQGGNVAAGGPVSGGGVPAGEVGVTPSPMQQQEAEEAAKQLVGEKKGGAWWTWVAVVILLLLIGVGGYLLVQLYRTGGGLFGTGETVTQGVPTTVVTPTVGEDEQTQTLMRQGSSDEVGAIETDVQGTSLDNLTEELSQIEAELP